jgi:hypothetical protein
VPGIPDGALHVTNGDAVVPEWAAAAGIEPADVLVWRDALHDGPVPAGLEPDDPSSANDLPRAQTPAFEAGGPGLEPGSLGPKPRVLPLHHPPVFKRNDFGVPTTGSTRCAKPILRCPRA